MFLQIRLNKTKQPQTFDPDGAPHEFLEFYSYHCLQLSLFKGDSIPQLFLNLVFVSSLNE